MLSFKHLFAAAFVVGSLVSSTAQAGISDYLPANAPRELLAVGVAATVWVAATYVAPADAAKANAVQKFLAQAKPYVLAIPQFANTNKDAIQATTFAYLVARYGKDAFNSIKDGLKFHNMKQGFPNAWVNVPAEEKAPKA
jgi:uncharacterized protein involved in high-affinity Fe2+ transport